MRRQQRKEWPSSITLRLWTYTEAAKAIPYIREVIRSLRDHWLEMQRTHLQIRRIDSRPGRSDRQALILRAEAARDSESAEDDFNKALRELLILDVYLIDPVRGFALIPFAQESELAWFVFDLFESEGISGWRFHSDPLKMWRPLSAQQTAPDVSSANKQPKETQGRMQWPFPEQVKESNPN